MIIWLIVTICISIILIVFSFILGIGLGIYHTKKQLLDSVKDNIKRKNTINSIVNAISKDNPALIKLRS